MTEQELNNLFRYHAPDSAEKTPAIRKIQEARMRANAGIACNEK